MVGAKASGNSQQRNRRIVFVVCCIVTAVLGLVRIESRAIYDIPGPSSDMVALDPGYYTRKDPDGITPISKISKIGRSRVRVGLRKRDVPKIAISPEQSEIFVPVPFIPIEEWDDGNEWGPKFASLEIPLPPELVPIGKHLFGPGGGAVVSAVPEPSSWLMMILGFLLLGYQIRRKKITFMDQVAAR